MGVWLVTAVYDGVIGESCWKWLFLADIKKHDDEYLDSAYSIWVLSNVLFVVCNLCISYGGMQHTVSPQSIAHTIIIINLERAY